MRRIRIRKGSGRCELPRSLLNKPFRSSAMNPKDNMKDLKTLPSAVYFDLEWNCAVQPRPGASDPEIVEIGLVALDPTSLRLVHEANYLVRPRHLDISLRCTAITGITRDDLVRANPLGEVLSMIAGAWSANATCFAWGNDGDILTRACSKHSLAVPFRHFVDLSRQFQRTFLLREQVSVRRALDMLEIPFDGGEHMAVTDARNTARIHAEMLRRLRCAGPPRQREREAPAAGDPSWFAHKLQTSLEACAAKNNSKPVCETRKLGNHDAEI